MRLARDVLERDLYAALGVEASATAAEIRRAHRREVRRSHPDLNGCDPAAGARVIAANIAARVLLDPPLRRVYDDARGSRGAGLGAAPNTAWYERAPRGDVDWVAPAPEPTASAQRGALDPDAARFHGQVRSYGGRVWLALSELLQALPGRKQIAMTALCMTASLLLIALVFPTHRTPTSVDPAMLSP